MSDADTHDAHLRHALRHAPDAQVQAPAALSDLILKEARAKARDAQPPLADTPQWAVRAFAWLARPAVATGFAGVMAATLVGLMWWDQPMDVAMPRSPVPATAPVAEPVPAASTPIASPPGALTPKAAMPPPAPQRSEPPRASTPKPSRRDAAPVAGEKPVLAPAVDAARKAAPAGAPVPDPAPAAAPAPTPGLQAPDGMADNTDNTDKRLRDLNVSEQQRQRTSAKTRMAESGMQLEERALVQLAGLRAAIARDPSRWTWERDATAQPMNDAVYAWLARLDASTGARWQPVDAPVLQPGHEIRLHHDGHLRHTFRFVENGVLWWQPQGGWQQVTLPRASVSALETSVP